MNTTLAVIAGQSLVNLIIWLIVAGLIYWTFNWALTKIALPEPFAKIAQVILVLIVAIMIVNALLGLAGHAFIVF